jgi:hypothetical protein
VMIRGEEIGLIQAGLILQFDLFIFLPFHHSTVLQSEVWFEDSSLASNISSHASHAVTSKTVL